MDSMAQYMPKSTFHVIYSTFVKVERALFEKEIKRCFASMFSSLEIRIGNRLGFQWLNKAYNSNRSSKD